jgi:hypothetical protein
MTGLPLPSGSHSEFRIHPAISETDRTVFSQDDQTVLAQARATPAAYESSHLKQFSHISFCRAWDREPPKRARFSNCPVERRGESRVVQERMSYLRSPLAMICPTLRAVEFPPWLARAHTSSTARHETAKMGIPLTQVAPTDCGLPLVFPEVG